MSSSQPIGAGSRYKAAGLVRSGQTRSKAEFHDAVQEMLHTLAEQIKHHINNPLAIVNSTINYVFQTIIPQLHEGPAAGKAASAREIDEFKADVKGGIQRITDIPAVLMQLLAKTDTVQLEQRLKDWTFLLGLGISNKVTFDADPSTLPVVKCDSLDLNLVFFNILRSISDASMQHEEIGIAVRLEAGQGITKISYPSTASIKHRSLISRLVRSHHGIILFSTTGQTSEITLKFPT